MDRCYLCKRHLFSTLKAFAEERGIDRILDGTNEDDMHVYRPGIRALRELGITSPLADLHITKAQVKELAAWYGISVASRPSTPCMATRIPYNTPIDYDMLRPDRRGGSLSENPCGRKCAAQASRGHCPHRGGFCRHGTDAGGERAGSGAPERAGILLYYSGFGGIPVGEYGYWD